MTLRELTALAGEPFARGSIPPSWLPKQRLCLTSLEVLSGKLIRLDQLAVRSLLEREHLDYLIENDIQRLDISTIRSKKRIVTQTLARSLYEKGAAGIVYRSNLDNLLCVALFEGRARLVSIEEPLPLDRPVPRMERVCRELHLVNPYRRSLKAAA